MIPDTRTVEQEPDPAGALPQEPFVRQVEDDSLPAEEC